MIEGITWIVVFVALISPTNGESSFEHLAYLETPTESICEELIPLYIGKAKEVREEIRDIGITTDCFPYKGTLAQYKAEQTKLLTFDFKRRYR